jgi:plastocyanin
MFLWIKKSVVVAAVAAGVCSGCQSGRMNGQSKSDPAFLRGDSQSRLDTPAESEVVTRQVAIDNFSFTPGELTVPVGTKVVWVNHDDVPHTVVSTARDFKSKALDTDDQYSRVFASAGTYPYFCSVHPHMVGQIIVK